ncbi:MAG: 2-oxo acid dehydrogenase subunit E2 [Leptospiraceae bacterium]|nr:2-oxo acid dehydrogenase subunit E2 [Leptospiraceae bacterium]MDW7976752.1 dihydrolipoamide acetyltransferase family protein [Leptospiraceae bacterium]
MARIIELMQLSPTMKTGTFVRWVKKPGDAVKSDTIIAEIETDKAIMEMMAFDEGILLATVANEGDQLPVGAPIAIVGEIGEEISELLEKARKKLNEMKSPSAVPTLQKEEKIETPPVKPQIKKEEGWAPKTEEPTEEPKEFLQKTMTLEAIESEEESEIKTTKKVFDRIEVEVSDFQKPIIDRPALNGDISIPPYISLAKSITKSKYPASPYAKKLAENYGVDLSVIVPEDGKRITAKDVENFVKNRKAGPTKEIKPDRRIPVAGIRKIIAERLYQSKANIPHYYLTIDIEVDPVLELREKMNHDLAEMKEEIKLTLNDFIIRAVAKSLTKHPVVNSSWQGDTIIQYGRIDIGIAVALDSGLITPYVRNADQLEFLEMVKQIRSLVKRARERKLKPEEYTNGTFTVSNLGMYGIKEFSAIINEPEAAIMAVGTIQKKPIIKNDQITVGNIVSITLSCDHRVIDGAEGASFLQTFKKYIENPYLMFV